VIPVPRPPRIEVAGETYHVFARGNRRAGIFLDEFDYVRMLSYLREEVELRKWELLSYCLMPNHFHLLLTLTLANLSAGMQRLKSRYGMSVNRRYDLTGHTFEGRFGSKLVVSEAHFLGLFRYVHMNPVEARLCRFPIDWPWSSHRTLVPGLEPDVPLATERVLELFGRDPVTARAALDAFVRSAPLQAAA
jgi:putative transposase